MGAQQDLFNPIQENGHTAYWNKFYGPTLRRIAKEKAEKERKRIEAQQPISILIKNQIK